MDHRSGGQTHPRDAPVSEAMHERIVGDAPLMHMGALEDLEVDGDA